MLLRKKGNKSHNFENYFYSKLAEKMRKELHNSNFSLKNKIIRFPIVWQWFSFWKFSKEEAKFFLKEMAKKGLIEFVPYNGIRLKVDKHGK